MQKNLKTSITKKHFQHTLQMPQTEFPSIDQPLQFFKTKQQFAQNRINIRIGTQVQKLKKIQQDYVLFLSQLLMCQCQFLKVFLIEPKFLYIQMNMSIQSFDMSAQQIGVEGKLISVLKYSSQLLGDFFRNHLIQKQILSESFNSQNLIQNFKEKCLSSIKKNYKEIFEKNI